jgi:L-alanine-DL-glutamate epimerase-like enolase superfamily enzyme
VKITAIETIPVRVPIDERLAIRAKAGLHNVSPFLIVKMHTDEGITGLGEVSCTPRWSGEDQVSAAHFINTILAPALIGQDPRDIERLHVVARRVLFGHPFTKSALEMAMWDIAGKAAGVPVYRLLGGAVREFVPTKWSISGATPSRAAEIAAWAVEQGFRTMKVKVGIDPVEDVARVRAVRQAIGPDVRLGVDANGAWPPATAIRMIDQFRDQNIFFAEQPVPPGDIQWMLDVRRRAGVPILADESVYTPQDAMAVLRAGAADALSIYVGKSAGIGPARKTAAVVEAAMAGATVGSNLELGIGTAAMIHFALATPGVTAEDFPCDIIGPFYYTDELLTEPLPIKGGEARPHERPGLGVELDEKKLDRYRVK